jgi:hypothetical protein
MPEKRHVPTAHRAVGISLARRSLGESGCEWNIGWEANAAVLNTASPNTFRDWGTYSLAKPAA